MFRDAFDEECRRSESQRMRRLHPEHIPVIIEPHKPSDPPISKRKYLVPKDLMVAQMIYIVRKRVDLSKGQSIFFSCRGRLPFTTDTIFTLDSHSREKDGFLYLDYTLEHTFGACSGDQCVGDAHGEDRPR